MLTAFLLMTLLAQSDDFVSFKRCYLDTSVSPPQFRPAKSGDVNLVGRERGFSIRPSAILYISEPEASIAGIRCVRIATASGAAFVQGSLEETERKLKGDAP